MRVAPSPWQQKIERLEFLSSQRDVADDVTLFYAKILRFQSDLQSRLSASTVHAAEVALFVPELLELWTHSGTLQLRELVASSRSLDWGQELESYWKDRGIRPYTPQSLAILTLLQPFARNLASHAQIEPHIAPNCPFCLCKPQLGVLRPEGEGGKRYLLCSLCGTEWEYRRVICPNCQELDKEKLPVYKSDKVPHIQLAACDTCHTYLKCIDLGIDGHAIPEVEDIASLPLSLWMVENGFHPIQLNLFGF
jgi:FdhE protein